MDKIAQLDILFQQFRNDIVNHLPDSILEIDIEVLHELGILQDEENIDATASLTRFFHVVEAADKITLFNDQFIVWVVPDMVDEEPITLTLIALNSGFEPKLELGFTTSGVYNTSRLVLRILEKLLEEIQETEELLHSLQID